MQANGINYYKGVLLCSRPNESPSISAQKEFCGRVHPHEQIGLVPVKQYDERKTKKRVLPVLINHKKWLEQFKKEVHDQKNMEEEEQARTAKRLQKIKQQGYQEREKMKNTSAQPQETIKQSPTKPEAANAGNHKKKEKPAWAKTAQQAEETEEQEVDQLLDFFNHEKETDLKDYVSDNDVKSILIELKAKVEKLKEQEDWKNSQIKRIEEDKIKSGEQKNGDKDDILSRISKQSGGQSVASQRTVERVQELQKKKNQNEWDKLSGVDKKSAVSVDAQIAKNIADEILRNYPALKHHSNQSIRQLLQKQAHEQLKS